MHNNQCGLRWKHCSSTVWMIWKHNIGSRSTLYVTELELPIISYWWNVTSLSCFYGPFDTTDLLFLLTWSTSGGGKLWELMTGWLFQKVVVWYAYARLDYWETCMRRCPLPSWCPLCSCCIDLCWIKSLKFFHLSCRTLLSGFPSHPSSMAAITGILRALVALLWRERRMFKDAVVDPNSP